MKTLVKIYVSTYHKYNSGSLSGAWLKLPITETGLRNALRKIAGSEQDPEYMIQDKELSPGLDFRAITESESIYKLNKELSDLRFEQEMQKKSPAVLAAIEEHKKVWPSDKNMIEFCTGRISDVYQTEAGDLIEFEIPSIEKDFCFNADVNGGYDEETEKWANDMAYRVSKTESYFIRKNMEKFDDMEKILKGGTAAGRREYRDYNTRLMEIVDQNGTFYWDWPEEKAKLIPFTAADIAGLLDMLAAEKAKFLTRLRRWWKRYGADGLHTWTYYSD